jgi:hypothetical protein
MVNRSSNKGEWYFTEESFDALLNWLNSDLEIAAQKYEVIRLGLIRIFNSRGLPNAEAFADEVIVRVSRRLPEIVDTYVGDPARYFYGVAQNVLREYLRGESESKFQEYLQGSHDDEYVEKGSIKPEEDLIALALINDKVRAVTLTADGSYRFLDSAQKLHNLVYVASVESATLKLKQAVDELETLVNSSKTTESQLQDFFERHPNFIINDDY